VNSTATLVSVIVPTCDRPAFLREALASIRAVEGPDLKFEILVGDNGKDPATKLAADEFGAVYIKVDRKGAGAARNAGLKVATGEFIAFLDDDDVWLPTNVRAHIALMREKLELECVFGQIITTDMELKPTGEAWPNRPGEGDELVEAMLSGYYPQLGGTVVRASVRDTVGLFDEKLLGDQDWDWQLRIARRRKVGFTHTHCSLFRQRPPGSFDQLRLKRLGFARKVFLRHAVPEWRVLGGPGGFMKSYTKTVRQYFDYFVDAAVERSHLGERKGTAGAIAGAFRVFPARTLAHILLRPGMRGAAWSVIWPSHKPHEPHAGAA
jgi:glycosyltransferase involved in cell wall biosynthesis